VYEEPWLEGLNRIRSIGNRLRARRIESNEANLLIGDWLGKYIGLTRRRKWWLLVLLQGSQATSADAEAANFITVLNCYVLKIGFPGTFGSLLGMADIMSELTSLATDVTFPRHTTVPPIRYRMAGPLPRERSIY